MIGRWFISQTWREACAARKHYGQLLEARRDELSPPAVASVQAALDALSGAMAGGHAGRIRIKMEELQFAVNERITPYAHPVWRGNLEVLVVALVLALGIRTFFLEPFKIPTGSMQPTLFGVTLDNLTIQKDIAVPTGLARLRDWFEGVSYVRVLAQADGVVDRVGPVARFLTVNLKQSVWIGGVEQVVWFPPDLGESRLGIAPLIWHPALGRGHYYHQKEEIINLRRQGGDYLLADRLTYNFRKPARGEIIVFKTQGISAGARQRYSITGDEFFIKRLVGLPGERVQIGDDRHLIINGGRLDAATPHFGKVYGFDPAQPPWQSQYWGHLNGTMTRQLGLNMDTPPLFPDQNTVYTNGPGMYLVMGDNTRNSQDSRYWGALSGDAVIGKCGFVFWPLTRRFGWGNE
jgi:signal peptidase I